MGANSSSAGAKPVAPSIFSKDLRITGDLTSDGEIHVDGGVVGDIRAKVLLVGESADIKGEIIADTITVHGRITGQIKARSVHLAKSAKMMGDVLHEDLSIEAGAFLEGHCRRLDSAGKEQVAGKDLDAAGAKGTLSLAPVGKAPQALFKRDDDKKITVA